MKKAWKHIKADGSKHYQSKGAQPIDLFKDVKLHPSLKAIDIFALCNNIKYSYRQLVKGISDSDCGKIHHYTIMLEREGE
jgi:hypothetical protein